MFTLTSRAAPRHHPCKGLKNGHCNRAACQRPGAFYYNRSTRAWYCWECAVAINRCADTDEDRDGLFGELVRDEAREAELAARLRRAQDSPVTGAQMCPDNVILAAAFDATMAAIQSRARLVMTPPSLDDRDLAAIQAAHERRLRRNRRRQNVSGSKTGA